MKTKPPRKMKNKLKDDALRLLAVRDRSEYELRQRLLHKHDDEGEIGRLLEEFLRLGYLDDTRFARNWVEYRNRFRPTGNFGLQYELSTKGVSSDVIEEALNPRELEYELALNLARAKGNKGTKMTSQKRYQRVASLLQRRGFNWDTAKRVLDEVFAYSLDTDL